MSKRGNPARRRPPPGASPIGPGRGHSAGATSGVTFSALLEAEWEAIRSTRTKWPNGIDWRREIERLGQDYWDAQATREMWVKKLQGKQPAKQREKIHRAWISMRQSRKALAGLLEDGLLDDDHLDPDLMSWEERLLEEWLSDYDVWVRPFAGKSNPIQARLEWELMRLWRKSGGKLGYSRMKDDPGTPYGPLVDFLTLTLYAILGKLLAPSGIAKMIDRHRGQRTSNDPWLMHAMHFRITKTK